ncbi:MAG: serpin family protein [Clostridia bacterium]|nr:serpin family protein [Clostridia bacterium]
MKALIAAMMIMLMASPQAAAEQAIPGEKLGFEMLKASYSDEENALLSPYSLYTALSMASDGAMGDTRSQLLAALEIVSPGNVDANGVYTANAAFIDDQAEVSDEYLKALEKYQARIFDLDTSRTDEINQWASETTDGLISPLLTEPLDENTRLLLLNAISMDAGWHEPFKAIDTREAEFHLADAVATVPFINSTRFMDYAVNGDLRLARLPYAGEGLNAYMVLPDEGGMDEALDRLISEGYAIFDGLEYVNVRLSMPKLDLSGDVKLSQHLVEAGITEAFSLGADFSGINGKDDLMLSEVAQKVVLKLDEDGTRAAAVTQAVIANKSLILEEDFVRLTLDRPFILLIRDEISSQTLFAACVVNPEN